MSGSVRFAGQGDDGAADFAPFEMPNLGDFWGDKSLDGYTPSTTVRSRLHGTGLALAAEAPPSLATRVEPISATRTSNAQEYSMPYRPKYEGTSSHPAQRPIPISSETHLFSKKKAKNERTYR